MSTFTLKNFSARFALPLWRWYLAGIFLLAGTNLITLEIPQLAKSIVNNFDTSRPRSELMQWAWMLIGLGILTILTRALSRIFLFWPGRKLEAAVRNYLFDRTMQIPQYVFDRFGMGDVISRLTNDIGQLRAFYAFGVLQFLNLIFLTLFTVSKMFSVHALLTISCLLPLVILLVLMRGFFTKLHVLSMLSQEAMGRLTNRVTEAFANVHVVKASAAEQSFLGRCDVISDEVYEQNIRALYLRTFFFPLLSSTVNLSQVTVVFYGGYLVVTKVLSIGDILAFNVYLAYLGFPLSALGIIISLYERSLASLVRMRELEDCPLETLSLTAPAQKNVAHLQVKSLNFSYGKDAHFSLQHINFALAPGKRLGVFGAIGAGKSTLFDLITRLKDPPADQIFLDGIDVKNIPVDELRQKIGYVRQTAYLFSDSIAANLKFGSSEVTDSQLTEAARQAQVLSEIEAFSEQWQTQIGERGMRLSGGQKQRLALARFMLRRPPILLLDDVFSAVDQNTEQRLIAELMHYEGAVAIASHRTAVLQICHEVIVMEHGTIIDRGRFAELLPRCGHLFENASAGES